MLTEPNLQNQRNVEKGYANINLCLTREQTALIETKQSVPFSPKLSKNINKLKVHAKNVPPANKSP